MPAVRRRRCSSCCDEGERISIGQVRAVAATPSPLARSAAPASQDTGDGL
jgi:hypothetical protein